MSWRLYDTQDWSQVGVTLTQCFQKRDVLKKRNWWAAASVELISKDPDKAYWKNSTLPWLVLNLANLDKKERNGEIQLNPEEDVDFAMWSGKDVKFRYPAITSLLLFARWIVVSS